MQADTILRQLYGECSRVGPIFLSVHNGFVRNKPSVSATAAIASARVTPARDITFVGIRNSQGEAVDRGATFRSEMENIFMAIVQIAWRVDRLEVAARNKFAFFVLDCDRLDPVNGVLKSELIAQLQDKFVRQQRV